MSSGASTNTSANVKPPPIGSHAKPPVWLSNRLPDSISAFLPPNSCVHRRATCSDSCASWALCVKVAARPGCEVTPLTTMLVRTGLLSTSSRHNIGANYDWRGESVSTYVAYMYTTFPVLGARPQVQITG